MNRSGHKTMATFQIPGKYLNKLGFMNYNHYGEFPWSEKEYLYLSRQYTLPTKFLAIDCEMVGVGIGTLQLNALARVSIVNEFGFCLYDQFVKPDRKVTDYRTRVSGIRLKDLEGAPDTDGVIKKVKEIVNGKVLVGHAIHHDLEVLKLEDHPHSLLRDTSVYFKKLWNKKLSLKVLTKKCFNISIQNGEHSSIEDAQATLKLYLKVRRKWEKYFARPPQPLLSCGHEFEQNPHFQISISKIKCQARVGGCSDHYNATCSKRPKICSNPAVLRLACGHEKETICNKGLSELRCLFPMKKSLPCGHERMGPCYFDNSKIICPQPILGCPNHSKMACYLKSRVKCKNLVPRLLQCGHQAKVPCSKNLSENIECTVPLKKLLECGHEVEVQCATNISLVRCDVIVKKSLKCGHQVEVLCSKKTSGANKCITQVMKTLPCRHSNKYPCHQNIGNIKCRVVGTHPCGHKYPANLKYCYQYDFAPAQVCRLPTFLTFPLCGHEVQVECSQIKEIRTCKVSCNGILSCGHCCPLACHVNRDPNHLDRTYCEICVKQAAKAKLGPGALSNLRK